MKSIFMSLGAICLSLASFAATMPAPHALSTSGNSTLIGTQVGTVVVTPISSDIFKVSRVPVSMRTCTLPASQSAILPSSLEGISWSASPREVVFRSATTVVTVDRASGRVTFLSAKGDTILVEKEGVNNVPKIKRVSFFNGRAQNFYGGGERGHNLRLNGDTLVMFNRQNYGYTGTDPRISQMGITMPWFASDAGYGVLFDDYNKADLYLGYDEIKYTSDTPKLLSYYFVNGNGSLPGVVSNYTLLTGRQQLPPLWALGYITSRYGYHNEQETLGAIDSLKQRGYPVDGIVLDLYWYGVETDMGRLEWSKKQFPDHRRMLDSLKNMGVHTVLISQPYVNKKGAIDNYNYLSEAGMLTKDSEGRTHDVTTWVGDAGMIDISNPMTRAWLWNRLKSLTADGVSGWWGDLGEPEVHPLTIRHANGETASQFHNVYGNIWSKTIYDGLRADYPEMRPLLMMRGGTAGLQRYSVFPWTTDVSRSWGGLEPQINLMLSAGLSGLGYMGSDVGGFAVDPADPYQPELYVRWLQMGTFSPMLRTHAQLKPEPYHYPKQDAIIKDFVKQRYQWLPYNYTLAYENTAEGLPLARPVNFYAEPGTVDANIEDQYLWGANVMVAPVMKKGARSRKVVFPAGDTWINWNNPKQTYAGGTTATVAAPLETLPMFVKAGSFIPQYMRDPQNVEQYDPQYLTVKYFPGKMESSYTLFDDNRKSPTSLSDGEYQLITFTANPQGKQLDINIASEGSYKGMPTSRQFSMEIPGVARPTKVTVNGTVCKEWKYNATSSTLTLPVTFDYKPLSITIL
ncbi:MAG: TIM-barrel domain-containing protein [Lepagella sp.]